MSNYAPHKLLRELAIELASIGFNDDEDDGDGVRGSDAVDVITQFWDQINDYADFAEPEPFEALVQSADHYRSLIEAAAQKLGGGPWPTGCPAYAALPVVAGIIRRLRDHGLSISSVCCDYEEIWSIGFDQHPIDAIFSVDVCEVAVQNDADSTRAGWLQLAVSNGSDVLVDYTNSTLLS